MKFEDLSREFLERAKACTSIEELKKLSEDEGICMSEEDLQGFAGGSVTCPADCSADLCFGYTCLLLTCPGYRYPCPDYVGPRP